MFELAALLIVVFYVIFYWCLFLQVQALEISQFDEDQLALTQVERLKAEKDTLTQAKDVAIKAKVEAKAKLS